MWLPQNAYRGIKVRRFYLSRRKLGIRNPNRFTGGNVSQIISHIRETDPESFAIYGRAASTGYPGSFERFVEASNIKFVIRIADVRCRAKPANIKFPSYI